MMRKMKKKTKEKGKDGKGEFGGGG